MSQNNQQDDAQPKQEVQVNTEKFKSYKLLDDEVKKLDQKLTALKGERFVLGREIVEYMKVAEIKNISVAGKLFYIRNMVIARIENQDEFFAFLKRKKEDEIIKYSINAKTLNSWTREWREDGNKIPTCLNVDELELIGMRKAV